MRRYAITSRIGTGASADPYRPDITGSWVVVATRGNWCLVKRALANGTAATADTVADMSVDADGKPVEIEAKALTLAQRTAIKNWLIARGFNVSDWASWDITTRRRLLQFVLRRFGFDESGEWRTALHGFDVSG